MNTEVPPSERAKEVELDGNGMLLLDRKILGVKYCPQEDYFFMMRNREPGGKIYKGPVPFDVKGLIKWTN